MWKFSIVNYPTFPSFFPGGGISVTTPASSVPALEVCLRRLSQCSRNSANSDSIPQLLLDVFCSATERNEDKIAFEALDFFLASKKLLIASGCSNNNDEQDSNEDHVRILFISGLLKLKLQFLMSSCNKHQPLSKNDDMFSFSVLSSSNSEDGLCDFQTRFFVSRAANNKSIQQMEISRIIFFAECHFLDCFSSGGSLDRAELLIQQVQEEELCKSCVGDASAAIDKGSFSLWIAALSLMIKFVRGEVSSWHFCQELLQKLVSTGRDPAAAEQKPDDSVPTASSQHHNTSNSSDNSNNSNNTYYCYGPTLTFLISLIMFEVDALEHLLKSFVPLDIFAKRKNCDQNQERTKSKMTTKNNVKNNNSNNCSNVSSSSEKQQPQQVDLGAMLNLAGGQQQDQQLQEQSKSSPSILERRLAVRVIRSHVASFINDNDKQHEQTKSSKNSNTNTNNNKTHVSARAEVAKLADIIRDAQANVAEHLDTRFDIVLVESLESLVMLCLMVVAKEYIFGGRKSSCKGSDQVQKHETSSSISTCFNFLASSLCDDDDGGGYKDEAKSALFVPVTYLLQKSISNVIQQCVALRITLPGTLKLYRPVMLLTLERIRKSLESVVLTESEATMTIVKEGSDDKDIADRFSKFRPSLLDVCCASPNFEARIKFRETFCRFVQLRRNNDLVLRSTASRTPQEQHDEVSILKKELKEKSSSGLVEARLFLNALGEY